MFLIVELRMLSLDIYGSHFYFNLTKLLSIIIFCDDIFYRLIMLCEKSHEVAILVKNEDVVSKISIVIYAYRRIETGIKIKVELSWMFNLAIFSF